MSPKLTNFLLVLGLIVLSAAIVADSMTKPIGHDEQMYCTAAALLAQGKLIYKDYSYIAQLPYHPTVCAALFKLFHTTRYLLVCRLLSAVCDILTITLIVAIYCSVLKGLPIASRLLGFAAAVLYIFNPIVDYANGFAWNHDIVILCVLLSLFLFITTDFRKKSKYWRAAAMGGLLTFASWTRMTTVLVYLIFLRALLNSTNESLKQRLKTILLFIIASLFVSIWPLFIIAAAPRAFILNIFVVPIFNGELLRQVIQIPGPSQVIFNCLTTPAYIILILTAAYFCITLALSRRKINIENKANVLLPVILVIVFFVITFIPPAMFKQYFAMPALFIIISFAYPLLYLSKLTSSAGTRIHFRIASVIIAFAAVITVGSHSIVAKRIPALLNPQSWPPNRLHNISEDIARRTKEPKRILTLAPLYALEGGCEIYPQFSAGIFVYRIAGVMNEQAIAAVNGAGPENLLALIENSPPSAVIIGTEPGGFEEPLYKAAVKPDWTRKNYHPCPVVFFRP
ncbi:hypothetical protein ACFL1G_03525 [Planctomycetota bacterium]